MWYVRGWRVPPTSSRTLNHGRPLLCSPCPHISPPCVLFGAFRRSLLLFESSRIHLEPNEPNQECDFEGRPSPTPKSPNERVPQIVGATERQCHLVFTGLDKTGHDLRSLRVTAHFGVDAVHKVGKVTMPIQVRFAAAVLVLGSSGGDMESVPKNGRRPFGERTDYRGFFAWAVGAVGRPTSMCDRTRKHHFLPSHGSIIRGLTSNMSPNDACLVHDCFRRLGRWDPTATRSPGCSTPACKRFGRSCTARATSGWWRCVGLAQGGDEPGHSYAPNTRTLRSSPPGPKLRLCDAVDVRFLAPMLWRFKLKLWPKRYFPTPVFFLYWTRPKS